MQCERARELLSAYIDDEIEGDERRAIEAHTEVCGSCAALVNDLRRIGGLIAEAGRESSPAALTLRVRRNARAYEAERPPTAPAGAGRIARWLPIRRSFVRQMATIAATGALSAFATWWLVSSNYEVVRLEQDAVSAHVRSLLQENPVQVAASDTHAVKPWFAGRVDFAPEVKDLSGEGFPLVGGRVDYVGGRRVGALVYKRRLHTINVFMWPGGGGEKPARLATINGYNMLTWVKNGLTLCAISDLNAGELRELQSLL